MLVRCPNFLVLVIFVSGGCCGPLPRNLDQFHYHDVSCKDVPLIVLYRTSGYSTDPGPKLTLVAAIWSDGCTLRRKEVTSGGDAPFEQGRLAGSAYLRLVDVIEQQHSGSETVLYVDFPTLDLVVRRGTCVRRFFASGPDIGSHNVASEVGDILMHGHLSDAKLFLGTELPSCWTD
jgi:hypothetical protein